MPEIPVQNAGRAGVALVLTEATAAGDFFANTGKEAIYITNGSGIPVTITIETPGSVDEDLAIEDREIELGIGETHLIGPFPKSIYSDEDGNVNMTYTDDAGVELAVIKIG